MRRSPRPCSAARRIAATSSTTRRAWRVTWAPTSVSDTARVVRCSTRAPRARSRAATVRDTDACDTLRTSAAPVNVPASTTASSARSCRTSGSIRVPYRRVRAGHFPRTPVVLILGQVLRRAATGDRGPTQLRGIAIMLGSALSNQVGAALGAHAFGAMGPAGVVAVRQVVAAAVLLPVARPPLRRMTWHQWWPVLLLAVVFGCMNLALYTAIDRIGLGLAVTLEFLGPLGVALAASRSRRDLLIAVAAAAGVCVLVLPGPTSDYVGLGVGVVGGVCWAAYIVLNRVAGARLPGLQAPAVATALCALAYLPVLVLVAADGRLTPTALGYAVAAGVLASVVPYAAD